jgi:hypothetical protein
MQPRSFLCLCAGSVWLGCGSPVPTLSASAPPPPPAAQATTAPAVQAGSTPQSAAEPMLPSMPVVKTQTVPLAELNGSAGSISSVGAAGSAAPDSGFSAGVPTP